MTEVEVINVAMDLDFKTPVVILKEKKGNRKLPIWMELPEARSIASAMETKNTSSSLYLAHDLIRRLIEKFEGEVDKVIINELKNNIYYAKILIKMDEEILEVDAHPSDAIILALKFKVSIYVNEDRISMVGQKPISDRELNEFRKKLEYIKPEDFAF